MGYGFLIFESKEDAENSLDVLSGKIMPKANKFFKLNRAAFNNRKNENEHSIYVCDLDPSINGEKLLSFFKKKYKSVTNAKIIIDPITKISKGYGFVIFSDEKEKEKALVEMSGCVLSGKAIRTGNASHKRIEKNNKNKMMNQFHQQLFIQQQVQQYYNNPFYMASNYFANLFNPLFQQQIYSQLEDYFNKPTDENDSKDSISNAL
jgi:RNA recognition motif-containing protein